MLKIFKNLGGVTKNILVNAGVLVSGSVSASILGLVSFALMARALGPEQFGIIALAQAYVAIIDRLFNFQSWQALIKYGSIELTKKNYSSFTKLITFGFSIDIITATVACIIGITAPYFVSGFMEWDATKTEIVQLFAIVIIFNLEGAPTAVLRLFDKYKEFAIKDITVAIMKLLLIIVGYLLDYGIYYYVSITILSMISGYLYLTAASIKVLKNNNIFLTNYVDIDIIKNANKLFSGIWNFVWTTNVHSTIRMITMSLDVIIVDSFLGTKATGLYQVAKQFAKVFTQVSQPLYKSIYPELTKLWALGKIAEFKDVVIKFSKTIGTIAVVIFIGFYLLGDIAIKYSVGSEFLEALPVLYFYLGGVLISVSAFPATPAILAMGFPKLSLQALSLATIIYFLAIIPLIQFYGLIGAGISYLLFYISWCAVILYLYLTKLKPKLESESTRRLTHN